MLVRCPSICNLAYVLAALPPMMGTPAIPVAQDAAPRGLSDLSDTTPLPLASGLAPVAEIHLAPTKSAALFSASCANHKHSSECFAFQLPPVWADHVRCVAASILQQHPHLSVNGCIRIFKVIMERSCFASNSAYVDQIFTHRTLGSFIQRVLERSMVRGAQVWALDINHDVRETRLMVLRPEATALEKERELFSEWSALYDAWKSEGMDGLLHILLLEFLTTHDDVLTFATFYGLVSCLAEPCLAIAATFAGLWHLRNRSGEQPSRRDLPYMWFGISRLLRDGLAHTAEPNDLVDKLLSFDWSGLLSGTFDREDFITHIESSHVWDATWATFRVMQWGMSFPYSIAKQDAEKQLEELERLAKGYRGATNSLAYRAMQTVSPECCVELAMSLQTTGGYVPVKSEWLAKHGCSVLQKLWCRQPTWSAVEALKLIVKDKFPHELLEEASNAPMSCQKILAALVMAQLHRIMGVGTLELNLNDLLTRHDGDPFVFGRTVRDGLSPPKKGVFMHETTVTNAARRILKTETGRDYPDVLSEQSDSTAYSDSLILADVALELAAKCALDPDVRQEFTTLARTVKCLLDAGVEARKPFATPCSILTRWRDNALAAVNSHKLTCPRCEGRPCQRRLILQRQLDRHDRLIRQRMETVASMASSTDDIITQTKQSLNIPSIKKIHAPRLPTVTHSAQPSPVLNSGGVSQTSRVPAVGYLSVVGCAFHDSF